MLRVIILKARALLLTKTTPAAFFAENLDADFLIILTAVEKAAVNFGKPDQKWLSDITVLEAERYIEEGHFAPGSMLPKVQSAVRFASSKGRTALITLLEKASDGINGKTGTENLPLIRNKISGINAYVGSRNLHTLLVIINMGPVIIDQSHRT